MGNRVRQESSLKIGFQSRVIAQNRGCKKKLPFKSNWGRIWSDSPIELDESILSEEQKKPQKVTWDI